ncbi:MAG: addiction module protein [Bryobacteraceae bacterium]|nr:addiction module protein [Bryobacteraceae bacterium]
MEVTFAPEVEKTLNEIATLSGRSAAELVQDAVAGYVDDSPETRATLDRRYDEIKSGKVKLIPGDEAVAYFREKFAAARRRT